GRLQHAQRPVHGPGAYSRNGRQGAGQAIDVVGFAFREQRAGRQQCGEEEGGEELGHGWNSRVGLLPSRKSRGFSSSWRVTPRSEARVPRSSVTAGPMSAKPRMPLSRLPRLAVTMVSSSPTVRSSADIERCAAAKVWRSSPSMTELAERISAFA